MKEIRAVDISRGSTRHATFLLVAMIVAALIGSQVRCSTAAAHLDPAEQESAKNESALR